jgi:hypothetical protein
MNQQEAQLILQSYRAGGQDANDPQFREALEVAKTDPELAEWFNEELALHRTIGRKIKSVPVPPDLKAKILAQQKIVAPTGVWCRRKWFALAACFLLLIGSMALWVNRPTEASLAAYQRDMTEFLSVKLDGLDFHSAEVNEIQKWLAQRGTHEDFVLPETLAALETMGCRVLDWRGNKVALICFKTPESEEYHLLVVDRKALGNIPVTSAPTFATSGAWTTATWSQGDKVYLLATHGGQEALVRYL